MTASVTTPLNILVLCTGNSCRSIMAEALLNDWGDGRIKAFSAGSNPTGEVHPQAIAALRRHGIDVGQPRSKSWDEFAGQNFDLVITVCDQAAGEICPFFPGKPRKLHWGMPDPAKASGTDREIAAAFDETLASLRGKINAELLPLLAPISHAPAAVTAPEIP